MNYDIFSLQKVLSEAFQKATRKMGVENTAVSIEKPKEKSHGDFSTPLAMVLAKKLKKPPLSIAQELLQNLEIDPSILLKAEAVAPGFINLRLNPSLFGSILQDALSQNENYGRSSQGKGEKILLEFVSANPTGPLNVVNARAAALGDSIANLLAASGTEVLREYYVNDAGNQARLFGESLEAAISRVRGVPKNAPEGGY